MKNHMLLIHFWGPWASKSNRNIKLFSFLELMSHDIDSENQSLIDSQNLSLDLSQALCSCKQGDVDNVRLLNTKLNFLWL